jgi:hypothetical protein
MSLSRWKLMAGVLGVSIGGLAAAASQCPKFDTSKGRSPEAPVAKAEPKVPPAGPASPTAPTAPTTGPAVPPAPELPPLPTPNTGPGIPAPPSLAPAGATPPLPSPSTETPKPPAPPAGVLPPIPADVTPPALPGLPGTPSVSAPSKPADPKPSEPAKPAVTPPVADLIPSAPAVPPGKPMPAAPTKGDAGPSAPGFALPETSNFEKMKTPPVVTTGGMQPGNPGKPTAFPSPTVPSGTGALPPPADLPGAPPRPMNMNDLPHGDPLVKAPSVSAPTVAGTKFRILLRVGEGEPSFEVKNGDNLVLKVACEKVDIKSPEKGGLSEVTAKGKVRFAGFGAEGTCDELKFLAGTGEVSMTGEVKVQVKDKLGRIESELTTGSMKYKIDASAVGGALKP